MVPMVTVLLHLAHARVAYLSAKARKYGVGLKYRIPFCQSEPSGATSALKTILQQKDAPVIEEEEQTLQEYIEHLWLAFSFRDEDRSRNTGLFPQIRGRDFMSIATQEEPFILKEHQVGLIPEGWVRFLDGFVPIVFYEGFSAEVIEPSEALAARIQAENCYWPAIPPHLNLLTTTMPCVQHLNKRWNPDRVKD